MTTTARSLVFGALLLVAALALAPSAGAQSSIEQILSYEVDWQIEADGDVLVSELIEYDFGPNARRGSRCTTVAISSSAPS